MCLAGVESAVVDDEDLPDDGTTCTADSCVDGNPQHLDAPVFTSCSDVDDPLAKLCDGMGSCVQCLGSSDCVHLPVDDDCQTRTCIATTCGQSFTAVDTPVYSQTQGDCKVVVCDGAGTTQQNVDDADLPIDNNDCTKDLCTNGTPINPPEPLNTSCGPNSKYTCDGMGTCPMCLNDLICGVSTFCLTVGCDKNNQYCEAVSTPDGAVLPGFQQTGGDCQEKQCDGNGGVKSVALDSDLPDDNNQCTDNLCNNGTAQFPPKANGAPCNQNGGTLCDGSGNCL